MEKYFYCDSLPATVLIKKGLSTRKTDEDNIMANGSIITVNQGQYCSYNEIGNNRYRSEPGRFYLGVLQPLHVFLQILKE